MRQVPHALLTRPPLASAGLHPEGIRPTRLVRLACVKHAASVHPEPGSNSHVNIEISLWPDLYLSFLLFVWVVLFQGHVSKDLTSFKQSLFFVLESFVFWLSHCSVVKVLPKALI